VPISITDASQTHLLLDLRRLHCICQILLVSENEYDGFSHFSVVDDPMEFLSGLLDSIAVVAVHHENQALSSHVVMTPQRTNLVLTSNVPNVEFDVFVVDCFYVESYCGNGVDMLAKFQLVQDGRFSGCVQTQHQDPHLFVAEHFGEYLAHLVCESIEAAAGRRKFG